MRRTAKWAVALLIAAFLGAGIAQVGATMSAKHTAAAQPIVLTSPAGGCSGSGCAKGGCGAAKKAGTCSGAMAAAKPSSATSCPMSKDSKAAAAVAKCPATDVGNQCTDCSQHPNCPDAKTTTTATKPASK